ncbi:ABC transporter permease [Subtercola frigoramans]|uniref:ABC-2 type transport system permease protein n=1 Tax=Subtercola frigoramans TaxID=120298 RepID=A0ABS2L1V8_9MICO|nr:ABC transporter permease [Subtercola frigoramans]MBM7471059.1 ABC-2 type transport system permease protein [Subtercola frigoramans]
MTATAPAAPRSSQKLATVHLTAGGILKSEWIKLTSLRSTMWSYAVLLVIQVAIGLLIASVAASGQTGPRGQGAGLLESPGAAALVATAGVNFGQLVVSVLGVLIISGEYSTGQIKSSFAAVPKRLPVLWAKAAVFTVVTFLVSLVAIVLTYFVTWPILSGAGVTSNLFDADVYLNLLGAALYLALIGLFALTIGAVLRTTAGAIAASLGLLLVVPVIFGLIPADWAKSLSDWMPGSAGGSLFGSGGVFEWWQGLLILLGWIVAVGAAAAVLMKRRDA